MEVSRDYEDLFKVLNAYKLKYLVVGGYAVIYHSEPRFTKDMDVWLSPNANGADDIYSALKEFGAPLKGFQPDDFLDKKLIYQIGVPPVRIDIMMSVPGLEFTSAWRNRRREKYGRTPIYLLGLDDLIHAKRSAGRPQDLIDLKKLSRRKKWSPSGKPPP